MRRLGDLLWGGLKALGRGIGAVLAGSGRSRPVDSTLRQDYGRAMDAEQRDRLTRSWRNARRKGS